jgi:glutamine amidotransferase|tara:strand:- start:2640 stop:3257 length:618 start_codon:yes stop_codon:yes gene_type:complete
MKSPNVTVIDYESGNIRSVTQALSKIGAQPNVTSNHQEILSSAAIILPGVGSASQAMRELNKRELLTPIKEFISTGKPFLGICLGLQILLDKSEEGDTDCIGVIPGTVKHFKTNLKIPHMGWNTVQIEGNHPIFDSIENEEYFYFVHSYFAAPTEQENILGSTQYGNTTFCSVAVKDNVIATQFHPEKSGIKGLTIYRNFVNLQH